MDLRSLKVTITGGGAGWPNEQPLLVQLALALLIGESGGRELPEQIRHADAYHAQGAEARRYGLAAVITSLNNCFV